MVNLFSFGCQVIDRAYASTDCTGEVGETITKERGIIFRAHERSSFVSSHSKLFKDRLLLTIPFSELTSKLLYSCCTLCFSLQGGLILASSDSAILDK